jgi:enamine deaminase RidA (YjgF/YER057c/UK114 family)
MPTISRFDLTTRLCRIACYDDMAFLFLSGDTPKDAAPDYNRQAAEVFARLDAMLARAGSHRSLILSATIWVDGIAACDLVERLFAEWIGHATLPALTIGAGRLVSPGKLIEVGLVCRRFPSDKEIPLPAIERMVKTPRISRIVKYGDLIFLAGVTSPEPDPDPGRQVAQVLARIDDFLAQAGSDKHHILSATVWLSDIRHADAMNASWDDWVSKESPPARATVEARLVTPRLLVEIGIIAAPAAH